MHNNADGLSRSRASPHEDTPPADTSALEEVVLDTALDALTTDPHLDGDPPTIFLDELATTHATLGPRQLLLEQAPCTRCHKDIPPDSTSGIVCDHCNKPFHLSCTSLTALPPTYWFCPTCTSHIHARGVQCPTEDLQLQAYLLGNPPPPHLASSFADQARTLSFTDQLYKWVDGQWLPYPPRGLQQLLLEEAHLQHLHVGGGKLHALLRGTYYWPTL